MGRILDVNEIVQQLVDGGHPSSSEVRSCQDHLNSRYEVPFSGGRGQPSWTSGTKASTSSEPRAGQGVAASPILSTENPSGTWVLLSVFRPGSLWAAPLRANKEGGTGCWRPSGNCPISSLQLPLCPASPNPGRLARGCQNQTLQEGAVISVSSCRKSLHARPGEDSLSYKWALYQVSTVSLPHSFF